jgi:hypothetical protein
MLFAGLTAADFDAFAPNKWRSNVFNRERLEVKQRLLQLGRELQGGMVGVDGSPLTLDASVEHPALWNHKQVDAQHLFFSRNEAARRELDAIIDKGKTIASLIEDPTPLRNHVFLSVSLQHGSIDVAVRLHPEARVDRQNLERKIAEHFEREKLVHLLTGLGAGFVLGVTPSLTDAATVDDARLEATLVDLGRPAASLGPQPLWVVSTSLPRAEALALGTGVTEWLRERLVSLLEVYRFIAWSRDNDFVSMRETLQKEKIERRQKGLGKGDGVRIVRGMFAGQRGVVQEVDSKGGLKILVGKLAVKLDAEDVSRV